MVIRRWGWPLVIAVSCAAAYVLYSSGTISPLRTLVTTWFAVFCPGMAFVRLLNISQKHIELLLAVVMSVVLSAGIGMILVYTSAWTLDRVFNGILIVTLVCVAIDIITWNWRLKMNVSTDSVSETADVSA